MPAAQTYAFFGAKGGAGTTTVAVNCGVELARLSKKPTLMIDLKPGLGEVVESEVEGGADSRRGQIGFTQGEVDEVRRAELPLRRADLRRFLVGASESLGRKPAVGLHPAKHDALARLRARLAARGVRLMLDFVPNHMALDHPWVETHPDYFVHGTEARSWQVDSNGNWVKG